ncbi:hypothetical protein D3C78_1167950 [compost metagenome]
MLQHLHVCTIQRADRQRPVQCKLHVTGSGCFRSRQRNLFGEIRCRNNQLRQTHAVVRDKDDLQFVANLRIVVDHFCDIIDEVNDVFCHVVRRGGFSGKNIHARHPFGRRVGLNAVVARNHMQHVHQLTFVLVDTFNLHVEQRFWVRDHVQMLRHVNG